MVDLKKEALTLVSKVHSTDHISDVSLEYIDIPQEALSNPLSEGSFNIYLNHNSSYNKLAIIHELGHRIDVLINSNIEGSLEYGSEVSYAYNTFRSCIEATASYPHLIQTGNSYEKEWKEIFARAYTQYVICKTKQKEYVRLLTKAMYVGTYLYFTLEELIPIGKAIDDLLALSNLKR